ncbi:MAG: PEGA domain-containing protein [Ignavibacteriaceae bacterium]
MRYFYLFTFIILSLFIAACEDSTTDPNDDQPGSGSIYMQSNPAGAQIWVDGTNRSRVTPDSITGLSSGSHQVTLKLAGYRDTTISVSVSAGFQVSRSITLTSDLSVVTAVDTLWETSGTNASQPSGIDLSRGVAVSSTSAEADIYYSSDGFEFRSSTSRNTIFYLTNQSNLMDGADAPDKNAGGWVTVNPNDRDPNYFFLYDHDGHYTKMKVIASGGGSITTGPAWVIVQWLFNTKMDDQRF